MPRAYGVKTLLRISVLSLFLGSCGEAEPESGESGKSEAQPTIAIRMAGAPDWHTASAATAPTDPGLPTTLVFALVGPGGSRTEVADFADHAVKLPHLQQGTWSIRGDGLDANGHLGWSAPAAIFKVTAGKNNPVTLTFTPVAADEGG
jgi:hypothetical protein